MKMNSNENKFMKVRINKFYVRNNIEQTKSKNKFYSESKLLKT